MPVSKLKFKEKGDQRIESILVHLPCSSRDFGFHLQLFEILGNLVKIFCAKKPFAIKISAKMIVGHIIIGCFN